MIPRQFSCVLGLLGERLGLSCMPQLDIPEIVINSKFTAMQKVAKQSSMDFASFKFIVTLLYK